MTPDPARIRAFATPQDWAHWLAENHATAPELWLRVFKKASGIQSLDWEQAVVEALAWGWIDGIKKAYDDTSYIQRFTPRRKGSIWSQKNRAHVERLLAEGRMQAPGIAHITAAQANGRWEAAYAGGAAMEIPADFLAALANAPQTARDTYADLNRQNLYAICYRLNAAKRADTRTKRIAEFIAMLARGERFH
ncbi:MAG: YdeI/OmpD-associated family protein [Paracoccaceae bacterium]